MNEALQNKGVNDNSTIDLAKKGLSQVAEEEWSTVTRAGTSLSPRRSPNTTGTSLMITQSSFQVLANVPEDGEIVKTEEDQTEAIDSVNGESIQINLGTKKLVNKNIGKSKFPRRPVLNKKDMIQVSTQSSHKKTSSRKLL